MLNKIKKGGAKDEVGWKIMLRDREGTLYPEYNWHGHGDALNEDVILTARGKGVVGFVAPQGSEWGTVEVKTAPGFHAYLHKEAALLYYQTYKGAEFKGRHIGEGLNGHGRMVPTGVSGRIVIKKVFLSNIHTTGETESGHPVMVATNAYIPSPKSMAGDRGRVTAATACTV